MNEGEIAERLGALDARVDDVVLRVAEHRAEHQSMHKELNGRLSILEKIIWGAGGVVASVSFVFGISVDWIKSKIGM